MSQQRRAENCHCGPAVNVDRMITAAASLRERILYGVYQADASDLPASGQRWSTWLQKALQGNAAKFDRRLRWDSLDETGAGGILGSDPTHFTATLFWAPLLREILKFLANSPAVPAGFIDDETAISVPFAHVLATVACFGIAQLEKRLGQPADQRVAACLSGDLIRRLSDICALTLGEEYVRFRVARAWSPGEGASSRVLYNEFAESLGPAGLIHLFSRYPVLARLVATALTHWLAEMEAFLSRLQNDAPEIARRFFHVVALSPVQSIRSSLSDPHRKGKTVKVVIFEDGRKIVYKPKSLAIDAAWQNLASWLRQRDSFLDVRAPAVWDCGDYGWIEFIEHLPCKTVEEARRFYRRAGILTCLFYVLNGTDFHKENLIASGAYPVPIDLETIFVPNVVLVRENNLAAKLLRTVLRSLMLPNWTISPDRKSSYDISGLGSSEGIGDSGTALSWVHINTDAMQFTAGALEPGEPSQNRPTLKDIPIDPGDFIEELIEGFERAYRALMRLRPEILARQGPLEGFGFRECFTRVVFRATPVYSSMLTRSLIPRLLANGLDRSLEFEGFSRQMLAISDEMEKARLFQAEVDALEQLDVPYFDAQAGSTAVRCGDGSEARGLISEAGFHAVVSCLCSLNAADLAYQVELIRSSFAARSMTSPSQNDDRDPGQTAEPLAPAEMISRAEVVGEQLSARAIWDGSAAYWIGLDYSYALGRYSLQPIGGSLYSGRAGIALFLAALYSAGGNRRYREIALGAARSIWRDWTAPGIDSDITATRARGMGIGAGTGLAGLAYSLTSTGRMLDEPSLIDDAIRVSNLITPEAIDSDRAFDVIGGSAGVILGLLPLWKQTREPAVLDRIQRSAAHLIQHQQQRNGSAGGWMPASGCRRPPTGFAHGAAGIAYALLRAHEVLGDDGLRLAANDAMCYEREVFLPAEDNWPDFRSGSDRPGGGWCAGAPGIGLARLACFSYDRNKESLRDLETAVRWIRARPPRKTNHLCCGELGNLELLLSAGRRLERENWVADAQRRGASVLARAPQSPSTGIAFQANVGLCDSIFSPGLFDGIAGVGYQMLRLAAPDRVPCVLLWE
jgi:type 2 lantibiotic biosynthesis protein LanM